MLQLIVAGSALSAAYVAQFQSSSISSTLFIEFGWSEHSARSMDRVAAFALLVATALICSPRGKRPGTCAFGASCIGSWFLGLAIASTINGDDSFSHLAIPAAALRIAAPIVLLLLCTQRFRFAELLLRLTAAATFATHALEAVRHNPQFVDLILLNARALGGGDSSELVLTEFGAATLLNAIGAADFLVAALVLVARWPLVAGYMAVWGAATAASRCGAFGLEAWPDAAIRLANGGIPLVLFLIWRRQDIIKA